MASASRHAGFPAEAVKKRSARTDGGNRPPSPEDVFVAWRLSLPDNADLATAAAHAIARIDCHAPLSPDLKRLRAFLLAAIDTTAAV